MTSLMGQPGELSFTIQITRKDGRVEEHQLVGRITADQVEALQPTNPEPDTEE